MSSQEVIVSLSVGAENIKIGTLWCHARGARESASFEYEKAWLQHPARFSLEPALALTEQAFHAGDGLKVFGAIGDSAPDRWGRVLMRRAESARARREETATKTLLEMDYLLGVNDEARQGALRFSLPSEPSLYLASTDERAIPPLLQLPKLLSATERFIADDAEGEDLQLLLAPGSSLGGARPKASVRDKEGSLAIAKFPRKDDEYDVVLWEAVALRLAERAGIHVPTWRVEKVAGKSVLIEQRFDRDGGARVPFLSAMNMLGAQDNESHSYLELAYALNQYGAEPKADLAELWRRLVLSIMISNTDDHLRNHGFLYQHAKGWRLSPVYDINPTPLDIKPRVLTTAIDFDHTDASLSLALSVAEDFRLSLTQARRIIEEVRCAVTSWQKVARSLGISEAQCRRMHSAFHPEEQA